MLLNLGLQLNIKVSEDEIKDVLAHFGIYKVDEILHKYGQSTLSYLLTIAKIHEQVPVTFPDHETLPDGNSYFLLLFSILY